jgi:hypothetical protein
MSKKDLEDIVIDAEIGRVTFVFGKGPRAEIHVMFRKEGGERVLEIEGGGRIEVRPRAANMVHVKLKSEG